MANELLNIVNQVNSALRSDQIKRATLSTVLAIHKPRIFEKGEAEDGSKIGTYGTKPISIAASKQARNTGKTFFKGGYSEYKSDIGKNPGYVNLDNTSQMKADYQLIQNGQDYGFGFQNDANAEKMGWMTDKYGKRIAAINQREMNVLADTLMSLTFK